MRSAAPPALSAQRSCRSAPLRGAAVLAHRRGVRAARPVVVPQAARGEVVEQADEEEEGPSQPLQIVDPRELPSNDDIHVVTDEDFEDYWEADRIRQPFHNRVEDFHDTFDGVSYEPGNAEQEVIVEGVLSPPGFDPDAPEKNAPPGGWPLLLLLPAVGSADIADEPADAALAALASSGYHERARSHVASLAFPFCPDGWAADGPRDEEQQKYAKHESFLLHVVLPHLRRTLHAGPVSLLGWAQGGWGAVSLLLRHPDVFAKAASWDAPLLVWVPDDTHPGMLPTFGHNLHYEPNYQLLDLAEDPHVAAALGSTSAAAAIAAGTPAPTEEDGYDETFAQAAFQSAASGVPRLGLFAADVGEDFEDAQLLSGVLLAQGVPHVFENAPIYMDHPDAAAPPPPPATDDLDLDGAFDLEGGLPDDEEPEMAEPAAAAAAEPVVHAGCEGLPGLAAERGWTTWEQWLPPLLAFLERGEGRLGQAAFEARTKRAIVRAAAEAAQQQAWEQAEQAAAEAQAEAAGVEQANATQASMEAVGLDLVDGPLAPDLGEAGKDAGAAGTAPGAWGSEVV